VSDSIIYEAQPIPPEDPGDRSQKKRTAILGTIGLVVLLLVGIAFGAAIFRGTGEDPLADTENTRVTRPPTRDDVTTTTVPLTQNRSFGSEDSTGGYAIAPRPPRGEPTPPLARITFDWERIVLDLSDGDGSRSTYIQQVAAIGDGFVALGMSYNEQDGTGQAVTWLSEDGSDWTRQDLVGDFTNANVWQFSFNEHGGIAIGDSWESPNGGNEFYEFRQGASVVWTTVDGSTWQRSEFPRETGSNQTLYLHTGVAGPNGFVVFGTAEQAPDFPPIIIEKDGLRLELSNQNFGYRVLDASGNVLASGSQDEIYRYNEENEGQGIYDPVTNELIVSVPYDVWEQAFADAYERTGSGPFGQFIYTPVDVVIEHGGYRITVNEETTYSVEIIATGEIIVSGNAESLWQGPPPVITDAGGNVLMSFTWDEFYLAQETSRPGGEDPYADYSADSIVYFSPDGVNWESRTLESGATQSNFESVGVTERGFIAIHYSYDEGGENRQVRESSNGLDWTVVAELPRDQYLSNMTQGAGSTLIAFGDTDNGQAVWASEDGVNWYEALGAQVPEEEDVYEWFNWLASGELGTVVVGSRETDTYRAQEPGPLTITQDEYTLTFDDYDWPPRITVVDNTTGDIVIDVLLNEGEETALPTGFYYEDGVTIIENNDTVLLAITDEEFDAAQQARWGGYEYGEQYEPPTPTMYFSTDLDQWFEVSLEGVVDGYINTAAIGSNAVVLTTEVFAEYEILEEYALGASPTITPDGFGSQNSELVIYVGRPQ